MGCCAARASRAAAGCMRKARREIVTPANVSRLGQVLSPTGGLLHRSRRMTGLRPDTLPHRRTCGFRFPLPRACGGVTRKREPGPAEGGVLRMNDEHRTIQERKAQKSGAFVRSEVALRQAAYTRTQA